MSQSARLRLANESFSKSLRSVQSRDNAKLDKQGKMEKESLNSRDSRHDSQQSLPLRRKRVSSSRAGRQHKPESRDKAATLPEIRINEPTEDDEKNKDEDDEEVFISIGIDLGTT